MVTEKAVKVDYFPTVIISGSLAVGLASLIYMQQSSWRYYLYAFFPVYFWQEVFVKKDALVTGGKILFAHIKTPAAYASLAIKTVGYVAALEAIVRASTVSATWFC